MMVVPEPDQTRAHLDRFSPISLGQLQAEAEFLTRTDRKYILAANLLPSLLMSIDPAARALEIGGLRQFSYESPYFDTPEYAAYHAALHGRPTRYKVRTRLYRDSGICLLEVKLHDRRGRTVKERFPHDAGHLLTLDREERDWLRAYPQIEAQAGELRHCMTSSYVRSTLVLPDGAARVTFDRHLTFTLPDGRHIALPHHVVVETKGSGKPTEVDRLLWRSGCRPVGISKFASGLCMLQPDLPDNRWHRIKSNLQTAVAA